jgi:hypothetical protein
MKPPSHTGKFWSVLFAAVALSPFIGAQVFAQAPRANISLTDGRTLQASSPALVERTNPGQASARYQAMANVTFRKTTGTDAKSLEWRQVARIDYYPVDGGAHCATILRLRDDTVLGIKDQRAFDLSDNGILQQLPGNVASTLRSARWRHEYKDFTAPRGLHHLRGGMKGKTLRAWDLLQCAFVKEGNRSLNIKSITFE